jgi:hypothetical protein
MSVGSFEFSDVVDDAVERAGGQEATAGDVLKIRRGLRILTERWTAQGYNTWRIKTHTALASGITPSLSLPDKVDDVIQVNSVRNGTSETTMRRISAVQYAQLTAKNTQGQPSQYYLDRKTSPKLFLFPIGDTTTPMSIVITYLSRPDDYERYGDTTDDIPGRWLEALVSGLALDLARKRPPYDEALISRLKGEAMEAEDLAQRADRDRSRFRYNTSYARY